MGCTLFFIMLVGLARGSGCETICWVVKICESGSSLAFEFGDEKEKEDLDRVVGGMCEIFI
jgi:hypothetical protein